MENFEISDIEEIPNSFGMRRSMYPEDVYARMMMRAERASMNMERLMSRESMYPYWDEEKERHSRIENFKMTHGEASAVSVLIDLKEWGRPFPIDFPYIMKEESHERGECVICYKTLHTFSGEIPCHCNVMGTVHFCWSCLESLSTVMVDGEAKKRCPLCRHPFTLPECILVHFSRTPPPGVWITKKR